MPFANTEGPDERAPPWSMIWTFSVRQHILQYPLTLYVGSGGSDPSVRMCRLIRAYIVCTIYKKPVLMHFASYDINGECIPLELFARRQLPQVGN